MCNSLHVEAPQRCDSQVAVFRSRAPLLALLPCIRTLGILDILGIVSKDEKSFFEIIVLI